MTVAPRIRKAILTLHITTSVGWLGAVLTYLALDLTTVASQSTQTLRGAYVAMGTIVTYAIVPLAVASVLIGIINALTTPWGLLRHYWVLTKLVLTLGATTVLLLEAPVVRTLANQAESDADPSHLPNTLLHSVGGTVVLTVVVILSVYKPRGVTRYGWRRQQEARPSPHGGEARGTYGRDATSSSTGTRRPV